MKKFLCLENNQSWYRDFKIGKIYTGDEGVIEDDHRCDWGTEELLEDGVIQPIETFEQDSVEWIRHSGGDCPVPGDWRVEFSHESGGHVFGRGGLRASLFCWGPIVAYRIISTGEPAIASETQGIEEAARRAPESITAVDPSPAPKFEPTATHTIPAAAVADIDYHPLMLGGKFGGRHEI